MTLATVAFENQFRLDPFIKQPLLYVVSYPYRIRGSCEG
jgi:hypothetical protein